MNKTMIVYTKEEALAMKPEDRPICFRIPGFLYTKVFESIGTASLCWTPRPNKEVFNPEEAEKVVLELLFEIAKAFEAAEITYETWPESFK